ncbi:MAG: LysM peptidoglycan-binding domain-containing protein [Silicimonas sp.]|nr:LysM peptidoglycan-binding domain-containing protein [Silicimonas sp.]
MNKLWLAVLACLLAVGGIATYLVREVTAPPVTASDSSGTTAPLRVGEVATEELAAVAPDVAPVEEAPAEIEAEPPTAEPEPESEPETVEAEPEAETVEAPTDAPAENEPMAPKSKATFTIVRVEPGGSTLIAGQSVPGAKVALLMDGAAAGEATADGSGGFFLFADLGPSETPRVLNLRETWLDGTSVEAPASVILAPVPPLELAATEAEPEPETEAAPETTPEVDLALASPAPAVPDATAPETTPAPESADAGESLPGVAPETGLGPQDPAALPEAETAAPGEPGDETIETPVARDTTAPAAPTPAAEQPSAPTVLLADEDGVRVLQGSGDQPDAMSNVSIDAITYDAQGEVSLSGRSTGASAVRVYLNNQPLIETEIGEGGQWRTALPDVDTGTYTLRVDELDAEGAVVSRAETPFLREAVEDIRALEEAPRTDFAPVSLITVQPGNTLWGIAREKYGEGYLFVRVFDANTDRIRNPDLIYPGQIFTVPD